MYAPSMHLVQVGIHLVTIETASNFQGTVSMAIVNGKPAIAYVDSSAGQIKYRQAADINGTVWNPVVIIQSAPGFFVRSVDLAVVAGHPALVYDNPASSNLEYVRATDNDGTTWGTTIIVVQNARRQYKSLAVINGRPTIAYSQSNAMHYIQATDILGTNWGTPPTYRR